MVSPEKVGCKLMFIELMGSKVLFLCSARKGRKEADIGEALTAKPIETSYMIPHFSPASSRLNYRALATGKRPILIRCALQRPPYVPLPAQVERMAVIEIPEIREQHKQYVLRYRLKNRSQSHPRRGPSGGLGEGGSKSGRKCRFTFAITKDFAVSTSPSRFLWLLSCAVTRK